MKKCSAIVMFSLLSLALLGCTVSSHDISALMDFNKGINDQNFTLTYEADSDSMPMEIFHRRDGRSYYQTTDMGFMSSETYIIDEDGTQVAYSKMSEKRCG